MARNWKKMSKEEEDKKRQETIDKAIETMNKGIYEYLDSDRFKTLLDTMSKFHDYSMNNTLLILGQNPRATHLAGYNKWQQDFNRQVKRGEKGLMIWMPVEIKVKEKQYVLDENGNRILGDDGKFKKEEVVVKKHTFKIGYTFDVSQTEQIEGKEVIELSPVKDLEGSVKDYQALTKALMEISPVPITIEAFEGSDVSSRIERLIATGKYFTDEEMEHYNSMNKDEILPAWLLEKCGLSDYTKNSQAVARPDWMEEYEILIDRDNDYVLLRDPDENVNQVWTASGKFLSTVQLENETVAEAMEEYYYNITKGGFYIPDRIKEGYMEEDYDNLSKEDIEL